MSRSWVVLSEWLESNPGASKCFEGRLYSTSYDDDGANEFTDLLVVTDLCFYHLERHFQDPSLVQIQAMFKLRDLLRVTSRRSIPKLVVVEFTNLALLKFYVEDTQGFIDAITERFDTLNDEH